ncbi:MAG: thioredoxin family protein [Trueperaceae bacterium]|nr:thioredoxin family protein [Trueperaceae bacterium]
MTIKILGPGCRRCQQLYLEAMSAVEQTGVQVDLVKVEDFRAVLQYGIMSTPAIVIDDRVKASGRIAPAAEIAGWIKEASAAA